MTNNNTIQSKHVTRNTLTNALEINLHLGQSANEMVKEALTEAIHMDEPVTVIASELFYPAGLSINPDTAPDSLSTLCTRAIDRYWQHQSDVARRGADELIASFSKATAQDPKTLLAWISEFIHHGTELRNEQAVLNLDGVIETLESLGYKATEATSSEVFKETNPAQFAQRLTEMFMADIAAQGTRLNISETIHSKYFGADAQYGHLEAM